MIGIATTTREHPGGVFTDYDVIDARTGDVLAIRSRAEDAARIVDRLNELYPAIPPARDTLVHEIVGLRISGELD